MGHRASYWRFSLVLICGVVSWAQLLTPSTPIPRKDKPPVVFLNGYQPVCATSSFSGTFGAADQVLQTNGEVLLFFDNCNYPGRPSIEALGEEFGKFVAALKYEDGQPVTMVDAVAHSMGGLILRSYLSGKQASSGEFQPPAKVGIRKAVFLGTPHFGTPIGLFISPDIQVTELTSGSQFLFDLGTWNQGTDDLRGIDALAVLGNEGTGLLTTDGFDDGVVPLTSGSIGWVLPGRTRVVPYCHTTAGGLITTIRLCKPDALPIAQIQNGTDPNGRLLVSFLNGTDDWKTVGTAAEDDPFLSKDLGLLVAAHSATDDPLNLTSATAKSASDTKTLNARSNARAYTDLFPAATTTIDAVTDSGTVSRTFNFSPGSYFAGAVKSGPYVLRVYPSASRVTPLSVAPGMFVSIYGDALASQTAQATSADYPNMLADVQVLVGGTPLLLHYASPAQINAVLPDDATGLVKLTVKNTAGADTVNVLFEPAVPAVFTQDGTGSGAAAALNSRNDGLVTSSNPLRAGDYLELFLTGLGATTLLDGLQYANLQPTVTIGGQPCAVSYAGRAPGYRGLDQINCLVPSGIAPSATAQAQVTSGTRSSNVVTVAVQ